MLTDLEIVHELAAEEIKFCQKSTNCVSGLNLNNDTLTADDNG